MQKLNLSSFLFCRLPLRAASIILAAPVGCVIGQSVSAATFEVSAAHGYAITGSQKFETEFSSMTGFNSPTVSGSAPSGTLVFRGASATALGGVMQIKLVDFNKATFTVLCEVGNSGQQFDVTMSDSSGGGSQTKTFSSAVSGGKTLLSFTTPQMHGRGDFIIRMTSNVTRDWNLYKCDVTM